MTKSFKRRALSLAINEERNVYTVSIPQHVSRELLFSPNPPEQHSSKRLSLMVVLASILIFFASIKVGIFAGYRLINIYIKTTVGPSSDSVSHPVFGEKIVKVSRNPNQFGKDSQPVAGKGNHNMNQSDSCNFNIFIHQFKPEELEINCNNIAELEIERFQGHGVRRIVAQATWRGRKVAVKKYIDAEHARSTIMQEASVLFCLRESENIVSLVGMCNLTTVLEYAPISLKDIVLDKEEEISVGRALSLGLDIVRGVAQLHSIANGPVVHGDIHLGQFLINSNSKVLLGDFDQIRYCGFDHFGKRCSYSRGDTWRWGPFVPEILSNKQDLDEKTDIYEVALVLWSLLSREWPYHDFTMDAETAKRIIAGERPDLNLVSDYPQEMRDIIVAAWDGDPLKRPSATDMVKSMEDITEKYLQG